MLVRNVRLATFPTLAVFAFCGCASNFAVYEPPEVGPLSKIAFVNQADTQAVSLATFDDGATCTRRRQIQFQKEDSISPGNTDSLNVPAGRELTLLASLDTLRNDEYGIDVGITGGGPTPVLARPVTAIGCSAIVSFEVELGSDYRVVVSEPVSLGTCTVEVSRLEGNGSLLAVDTSLRTTRSPRDELGSFCEPLAR